MTAVIGILNRHAVAIAADSAVTITGRDNRKIFNSANKIFALSKFHPVGVMMYNSASFMGTPWETIIKIYRKSLNNNSFGTLQDYVTNFIEFIHQRDFFTDEASKSIYLKQFFIEIYKSILYEAVKCHRHLIKNPNPDAQRQVIEMLDQKSDQILEQLRNMENYCPEFQDYARELFDEDCLDEQNSITREFFEVFELPFSEIISNKLKTIIYHFIRLQEDFTGFTGLIFTGFGENDIYPRLIPVDLSLVVGNRLRYFIDQNKEAHISNDNPGFIRPFAQRDVIDTILSGVDPLLDDTYMQNFTQLLSKYNSEILNILGENNHEIVAQINGIDINAIIHEYEELNNEIKRSKFIFPLLNAVSNLSKEDLAEMAESMIYLTYLKRRITFAEESVGGPVDVAIISKGDGFIWIKRKHYFKPELNQHFVNNYLNT